mmetsp:Transcript_60861/g.168416  ORF Transcript_60861/g.168416 Transcript_60861/m.168416 type:complete len:307 (+) Transcript_60861:453-1373(+)
MIVPNPLDLRHLHAVQVAGHATIRELRGLCRISELRVHADQHVPLEDVPHHRVFLHQLVLLAQVAGSRKCVRLDRMQDDEQLPGVDRAQEEQRQHRLHAHRPEASPEEARPHADALPSGGPNKKLVRCREQRVVEPMLVQLPPVRPRLLLLAQHEFKLIDPRQREVVLDELPPRVAEVDNKTDGQAVEDGILRRLCAQDDADGIHADQVGHPEFHDDAAERAEHDAGQDQAGRQTVQERGIFELEVPHLHPSDGVRHEDQPLHAMDENLEVREVDDDDQSQLQLEQGFAVIVADLVHIVVGVQAGT